MPYWTDINTKNKVGQFKTTCPSCSHNRRKKNEPCLSVNTETGIAYCHNCNTIIKREGGTILGKKAYQEQVKRRAKIDYLKGLLHNAIDDNNSLLKGISEVYGYEPTLEAFKRYKVATKWNKVIWHYIDKDNRVRYAKEMTYNNGTHRGDGLISTPMECRSTKGNFKPCLFGLHLVEWNKPNVIVESEKTALIASIAYPEYTWLATGGKNRLPLIEEANLYKGATLIPDKGEQTWFEYAKVNPKIGISNVLEERDDLPNGADLADILI